MDQLKIKKLDQIAKQFYYLIPVFLYLIIYYPSIFFEGVWGDDQFVTSYIARDLSLVIKSFYNNTAIAGGVHYFPLFYLQCYLINKIFGGIAYPFGFHLYQYILQAIVCLLATVLINKITGKKLLSVLVVSIWVVHPINVQNFTRLLLGPGLVAGTAFIFACMIMYLNANILLGSLFLFLSLLCCEVQFLLPLILFFVFIIKKEFLFKRFKVLFLTLFFVYSIYIILRTIAASNNLVEPANDLIKWTDTGGIGDILFRAIWLSPQLIMHYLKLFFFPYELMDSRVEWYKVGNSVFSVYSLFSQLVVLGLIILAFLTRKKIPIFSIGILWFFISYVLVIQIIPLFSIVSARYCYTPYLGLILALIATVEKFKNIMPKKILISSVATVFLFLTLRTFYYFPSYKDPLIYHIYCTKEAPLWNKPKYLIETYNIAKSENKIHELPLWINKKAIHESMEQWLKEYLNIKPDLSTKFGPMQMAYNFDVFRIVFKGLYEMGRLSELSIAIDTALKIYNRWLGWHEVALFFTKINAWQDAWKLVKKSVSFNPGFELSYNMKFVEIAVKANKTSEAEELINNYIKIKTMSSHPYLFAGYFFDQVGLTTKATRYFKLGISSDKTITQTPYLYRYAVDFFEKNKMPEDAKEALKIKDSFSLVYEANT